jgi:large repetitive protein
MRRYLGLAVFILAASCGYPNFQFGPGGTGGAGSTSSSSSTAASSSRSAAVSSSSSSSSNSSSSASSSGTGGAACTVGHLLISQILSHGPAGPADEFIEIYNPTATPVVLDSSWAIKARSTDALSYAERWTGDGSTLPAYGHYLVVGASYSEATPPDAVLSEGIADAGSVILLQDTMVVDAVCYTYDLVTQGVIAAGDYTCNGTPADNSPHDDGSDGDPDQSLLRRPGGAAGNCTDTGDNSYDFIKENPSTPSDLGSPPAP